MKSNLNYCISIQTFVDHAIADFPDDMVVEVPRAIFRDRGRYLGDSHTATRAVEMLIRRGPGRFLVVTHGGILNAALRHTLGTPPPLQEHGVWFEIADTGYVQTSYDPSHHRWTVHAFDPGEMSDE